MAGQPVIAGNAPNPSNELAMAMQGYSPQTVMAAQHSQYLAQALAGMREQSQNIRTPVALASDMLANALLQRKYGQSMQDFATAARADQGSINNAVFGDLKADAPATPPAAAPAQAAPDASAPPPPPPPMPQNTAPAPAAGPDAPRGMRDNNPLNVTTLPKGQTWNGQTGTDGRFATFGDPAAGWQAADTNLHSYVTRHGLNTVAGIVSRWAPAAGGNDPAAYAMKVSAQLGVAPNQPLDLSTPEQRAPLLRAMAGVELGQPYSGPQTPAGMDPGRALTPGGQPNYSPPGQPGPLQVPPGPQSSPSPSPSASGVTAPGGPAGAPPAAASPAAGGASPPQFLHAPVTDAEIAYAQKLAANPMTRQMGLQMGMELKRRQLAAIEPKVQISDTTGQAVSYDPYGRSAPTATQISNFHLNPTASIQGDKIVSYDPRDPMHPTITQTGLPTERKAMMMPDGKGGYVNVPGPMTDSERGAYLGLRNDFYGSKPNEEYEKTANALNAVNDMLAKATKNNGVLDMGVLDNLIQAQTGLSARQGNVQLLMSHLGVPQELMGRVSNLFGNGPITPEVIQQMRSVLRSYATQQAQGAQHRLDQQNAVSKAQGFGDLGITLLPLNEDVRYSFQPAPAVAPQPTQGGWSVMGVTH